jgi:hypothetical protein
MSDLPSTIHSPSVFLSSPPAGFDGVFDWSWMVGCWADPTDKPMDLDCFKERKGQFLVCETKKPGKKIPRGQMRAFEALHGLGCFTVMIIYGKPWPEFGEIWFPGTDARREWKGVDEARDLVRRWFAWADNGGKP